MKSLKELFGVLIKYLKTLESKIRNLNFNNLKEFIVKRKVILIFAALFLVMSGAYTVKYNASKEKLLNKLEVALKNNRPGKIYKKIKVDGDEVSKDEIEPLCKYYSENNQRVSELIKSLRNNDSSGYFTIINENGILFNKYYIEVKPVSVSINSEFEEIKISINNNEVLQNNIKFELIPGKYLINTELTTSYGVVKDEKEAYIIDNMDYKLDLPVINITLTSNFEDADVFINNENTNKKVSDIKDFGPIPLNKDISIYLQKELPWGIVKSEEVKIGNLPNININIDLVNDKLISDINKAMNSFYKSVFEALNKSDYTLITNSEDDTKNKIYNSIKQESLFLKNNYKLDDLKIEIKNSEFYFEDNIYKGKVVINLNYNISKKILPFIYKNVEETFLTNLEYENKNWIITDVQKFKLE